MTKNLNLNIAMNLTKHGEFGDMTGLSLQNLFIIETGKFPNVIMFTQDGKSSTHFDVNGINNFLHETYGENNKLESICIGTTNLDTHEETFGYSYVNRENNLYFRIENSPAESYILYDYEHYDKAKALQTSLEKFYVTDDEDADGHVFTLASGQMGFFLEKAKITVQDNFDIKAQYNDDFLDIDDNIRDFIEEKEKSGIMILHGEKGAGKTTYIRHLISQYPDIKFVTIPPAMVAYLNDPSFTMFMHDKLKNSVIILEDCEAAITDRKLLNNNNSVSVLLNIGDGLMSDDLGIKFICTFNAEIGTIDDALLRKGRLVVKYEFKVLCLEKTNALLPQVIDEKIEDYEADIEEISSDEELDETRRNEKIKRLKKKIEKLKDLPRTVSKGLSLADIYNIDETSFIKDKKQIGF